MSFFSEPSSYEKTILSDLKGAWECLREAVVEHAGFEGWDRVLFHIDEALSWETVRHLERMEPLVVLIRNLAVQGNAPQEVFEEIAEITDILKEVYQAIKQNEPL
jgi:endonuclease IV